MIPKKPVPGLIRDGRDARQRRDAEESVVFFYAEHTPLTDAGRRVIVGTVPRLRSSGSLAAVSDTNFASKGALASR
jgi:hypothetical protein